MIWAIRWCGWPARSIGVSRSALCQRLHVRPRPTPPADRLVAGLFILKRTHNLSGEVLCARWLENPYYQFFYGELLPQAAV